MPASHQPEINRLFPVGPNATQLPLTAAFKRCLPVMALLCLPLLTPPALAAKADPSANYSGAEPSLRLISYNIRCGYCEPADSPHHWDTRKFLLAHQLKLLQPDLVALQEAEHFQIAELSRLLPEYRWYGVGRDDGQQRGEATAVLYRHSKLALLQAQTLWLSPTPQQVSNGWGAQLNRTLTLTRFRQLATGAAESDIGNNSEFYLFNTHFDHQSDESRRQSAALILRQAAQLPTKLPLLLAGDLNLTSQHPAYLLLSSQLQDAATLPLTNPQATELAANSSKLSTFNGFGQDYAKGVGKIDFVFVRGPLRVNQHWIEQRRDQGLFPSDHDPVIVDFQLTQP